MRLGVLVSALLFVGALACGDDSEAWVDFPHEIKVPVESALKIPTGKIINHPDFLRGDLVLFKSSTVKVQAGCLNDLTDCLPIHVCKPNVQAAPTKYDSLDGVCKDLPGNADNSNIPNVTEKMGFTVELNTTDAIARVWIKAVEGQGDSAVLTLVYDLVE
jgi:hypothetical protein